MLLLAIARRAQALAWGLDALCQARPQQMAPRHVEIGERAGYEQSMRVFVQPAIANSGKAKNLLDHEEHMLDLGSDFRLCPVLCPLVLIDNALLPVTAIGEVLRARRMLDDHVALAAIGLIAPHAGLLAV